MKKITMKIVGLVILLTVILIISVVGFIFWSETHTNQFKTYQDAQNSGIISRGWIPAFIPPSSHNIKEHHRVDISTIYVEFDFKKEDISHFRESCAVINPEVFKCNVYGGPVKVTIKNENHAIIESI